MATGLPDYFSRVQAEMLFLFLDLSDVPADYVGDANKCVRVNAAESGLEFIDPAHTLGSHSTKEHDELTDVSTDQHHAEEHSHVSHTGIGTDDHHAQAHTLASHSTKTHTELSDVSSDQHHSEEHHADHENEGDQEISVTGLSGLLADDQHVLDSEVLAVVEQYLPWMIDIDVFMTAKSNVNFNTNTLDATYLRNGYRQSLANQNDSIAWDVILAAGTWSVELMYRSGTNKGIFSIQFDSVEKGTIDSYDPVGDKNVRASLSGISVAATAKIELKLKMANKNDLSSNYHGMINGLRLIRTS